MVTALPTVMPRKRDDVLVADFDTELVVMVPRGRRAHLLDEGLSLVLDSCDGSTRSADVVAEVADATGQTAAAARTWLADALGQLADLALFESDPEAVRASA